MIFTGLTNEKTKKILFFNSDIGSIIVNTLSRTLQFSRKMKQETIRVKLACNHIENTKNYNLLP